MLDGKKDISYSDIVTQNPVLILGIGLCPLLSVANTFEKSYVIGIILIMTLFFSTLFVHLINKITKKNIFYVSILVVTLLVTMQEYFLYTYVHDMYQALGIYLPLIAINFMIIENFSFTKISVSSKKILSSLKIGLQGGLLISVIGLIREVIGNNTITLMDKISHFTGYISKYQILSPNDIIPNPFFLTTTGGFLILAFILAVVAFIRNRGVKE